ncbi:hypothetical protein PF005_g15961 [Phytophthora fragariae]|uniref:Uncharacterized protein n=1 Tax=Phytophthora fragariae TaxID=53985 RepID=A0A6A3KGW9_9STRA|nr:hypothetical protein PF003_g4218 [Phytophthora fragariae]KAE8934656.1 hypothetical protein PF009_g15370 [Phytophthora fragariae]KAE9003064.1 hypothetical protein PF011_g13048 [Phytophthora fragariae]KAE9093110.1 hypothetical protein PF006_g24520 [Phytophthora fragariae]KAE9101545.1 hypothetical protein PF010_g14410 [Phytophthora fragariae]
MCLSSSGDAVAVTSGARTLATAATCTCVWGLSWCLCDGSAASAPIRFGGDLDHNTWGASNA